MKKQQEEFDELLKLVDENSHWNDDSREKLKRKILHDVEKKSIFHLIQAKTPIKYYVSFLAAAFLLFVLLVPFLQEDSNENSSMADSINFASSSSAERFDMEMTAEREPTGYSVILKVTNEGDFHFTENEVFIKDFSGKGFSDEFKVQSWSYVPENKVQDRNSILLLTEEIEGDFDLIQEKETAIVSFFVPHEFIENENYKIMFHSFEGAGNNRDASPTWAGQVYHVLDFEKSNISFYDISYGANKNILPFILLISGLLIIFVVRKVSNIKHRFALILASMVLPFVIAYSVVNVSDDESQIKRAVKEIWPMLHVVHVEMISDNEAFALYGWGGGTLVSYGYVPVKKTVLGWKLEGGSGGTIPHNANYTWGGGIVTDQRHIFSGRVLNKDIDKIVFDTGDVELETTIITFNEYDDRLWFIHSNKTGSILLTGEFVAYTKDGKIIENFVIQED